MSFLGAEIGGTKLQVGVCDSRGKLLELVREPVVRSRGAAGILQQFQRLIPPLIEQHHPRAIGVGFGGPFDSEHGRAIRSHQIRGWENFPVKAWFEKQFKRPVFVENDQKCAVLAEATSGAGRGLSRVFYITVGTGIGGGFVVDGRIDQGRFGGTEVGHMRLWHKGRWKTVESLASGLAIERGVSTITGAARHLGVAVANVIALVNPEIVIVGGGVTLAGMKFFRPLRQTVKQLVFEPFKNNFQIVPPQLGRAVVVVGASLLAARRGH